jgi:hypothetical protein
MRRVARGLRWVPVDSKDTTARTITAAAMAALMISAMR